ncbi:MAG: rod shape-determining protein RodA, partial [Thermodesulfobacteriota bacterium]
GVHPGGQAMRFTGLDKKLLAHIDLAALSLTIALAVIGLVSIYSATHANNPAIYTRAQYWFVISLAMLTAAVAINYHLLERFAYVIYGGSIALLLLVAAIGKSSGGAQRWLDLGVLSLQPSEIAKIALIIMLARHFSLKNLAGRGLDIKDLIVPVLIIIAPFFLVMHQPDLGTSIILLAIFCSMTLVVGIRLRTIVAIGVVISAIMPFAWLSLKDYQKARLTSFLNPGQDPFGSGYHLLQSKIAIGSGGFFGKGFTHGTQGKLMFLPEHHTDFIFSILAEEWGFIGASIVVLIFFALILKGLGAAASSKDRFGFLLAFGISSMLFWHVVINLAMVTGLLPVVGVPLPFLSYGGSFLAVTMTAMGLIINIRMRRFIF